MTIVLVEGATFVKEQRDQPTAFPLLPLVIPFSLVAVVVVGAFLFVGNHVASLETEAHDEVWQQVSILEDELEARDEKIARLTAAYTELWVRAAAAERVARSGKVSSLTIMGCDKEGDSLARLKEIERRTSIVERRTGELLAELGQLRVRGDMKKAVQDRMQGLNPPD